METETLLRVVAVIIAAMILATNWDYSWVLPKIKSFFVFKKSEEIKKEVSFLEINLRALLCPPHISRAI